MSGMNLYIWNERDWLEAAGLVATVLLFLGYINTPKPRTELKTFAAIAGAATVLIHMARPNQ